MSLRRPGETQQRAARLPTSRLDKLLTFPTLSALSVNLPPKPASDSVPNPGLGTVVDEVVASFADVAVEETGGKYGKLPLKNSKVSVQRLKVLNEAIAKHGKQKEKPSVLSEDQTPLTELLEQKDGVVRDQINDDFQYYAQYFASSWAGTKVWPDTVKFEETESIEKAKGEEPVLMELILWYGAFLALHDESRGALYDSQAAAHARRVRSHLDSGGFRYDAIKFERNSSSVDALTKLKAKVAGDVPLELRGTLGTVAFENKYPRMIYKEGSYVFDAYNRANRERVETFDTWVGEDYFSPKGILVAAAARELVVDEKEAALIAAAIAKQEAINIDVLNVELEAALKSEKTTDATKTRLRKEIQLWFTDDGTGVTVHDALKRDLKHQYDVLAARIEEQGGNVPPITSATVPGKKRKVGGSPVEPAGVNQSGAAKNMETDGSEDPVSAAGASAAAEGAAQGAASSSAPEAASSAGQGAPASAGKPGKRKGREEPTDTLGQDTVISNLIKEMNIGVDVKFTAFAEGGAAKKLLSNEIEYAKQFTDDNTYAFLF